MSIHHAVYVSTGLGVHDRRWIAALEACGFSVEVRTVEERSDGDELAEAVASATPADAPVLAGPLDTVARRLVGLPRPVIGLSWGYDLQQGHSKAVSLAELGWIRELDGLVVDSPATRDLAVSLGLPGERIALIPWGVDLENFTPDGARITASDHGFHPGNRVVISLRTHDEIYRTRDVVEAFARAAAQDPALVLVMGGDGPLASEHRARVADLGLAYRVRFIGRVDEDELPALLRGADLYVTASETDGTSVTLLQAMACGTPVAASANAGNEWWIIEGETGREFEVGDVDALAGLMTHRSDSSALGAAAQARVRELGDWAKNQLSMREVMTSFRRPLRER
jgi:glycosyltransferase involved in cell wall biosynthesis